MEAYYGSVKIRGRKFTQEEIDADAMVIRHLTALTEGDSSMNLEKIRRHMDQWLSLADLFGVIPTEDDLVLMEERLAQLKDVDAQLTSLIPESVKKIEADMASIGSEIQNCWAECSDVVSRASLRKLGKKATKLMGSQVVGRVAGTLGGLFGKLGFGSGDASKGPDEPASPSGAVDDDDEELGLQALMSTPVGNMSMSPTELKATTQDIAAADPMERAMANVEKLRQKKVEREKQMIVSGSKKKRQDVVLAAKMRRQLRMMKKGQIPSVCLRPRSRIRDKG